MIKYNISHSLINSFNDVELHGKCGKQFEEINLLKNFNFETTEAQALGLYFEYMATGSMPRSGIKPEPERTKAGELTAPYKHVIAQVENFKKQLEFYELTIEEVSKEIVVEFKGIKVKMILDIVAKTKAGKKVVIDTKCTGLIENKWEDYGWHLDKLAEKERLTFQSVMYVWGWKQAYNEDIDFYWWLHSPSNDIESKIIKASIISTAFDKLERKILYTNEGIEMMIATGFEAKHGKHNCILNMKGDRCPVTTCKQRMEVPVISVVEIS